MIILYYYYMLYIIINKLVRIYAFMHFSNFFNLLNDTFFYRYSSLI